VALIVLNVVNGPQVPTWCRFLYVPRQLAKVKPEKHGAIGNTVAIFYFANAFNCVHVEILQRID
jgi:hypothetical protein